MAQRIRSFWKGQLRLALVNIPVRLMTAVSKEGSIGFHLVDRESKQRIRYEKTAPGVGSVANEDIVYGYEVEPGNYVLLEDEELDELKLPTKHRIELTQFVDTCEIDPLYFEKPYYVLPDGEEAEEAYCVVRDALREEKKVGVGQLTLRGKENLVALSPSGNGLMLETLRYDDEIKDADKVFEGIRKGRSRSDLVSMAKDLIERRAEPFDPTQYKNHYSEALRDLVRAKIKGGGTVPVDDTEEEQDRGKVVDFMDALKKSLGKKAAQPARARTARSGKPRSSGRRRKAG